MASDKTAPQAGPADKRRKTTSSNAPGKKPQPWAFEREIDSDKAYRFTDWAMI